MPLVMSFPEGTRNGYNPPSLGFSNRAFSLSNNTRKEGICVAVSGKVTLVGAHTEDSRGSSRRGRP